MSGRRIKLFSILVSIVFAGVVLAAWTQTWFTIEVHSAAAVVADGSVAAPALTALALSELVLLGAIAIAGRFFRYVLAVIQVLVGVAIVSSAAVSIGNPVAASGSAITKATGISGDASIAAQASSYTATAWPVISLVAGALIIAVAVVMLVTARSWPGSASRKYQTTRTPVVAERTAVDDWDSLSNGEDPTSTHSTGAA